VVITLVVYSHVAWRDLTFNSWFRNFSSNLGTMGVGLSFVISGFIITLLLIREREKFGRISIRLFYARRVVRLWPTLWIYVATVAVLSSLGLIHHVETNAIIAPLTFSTDYLLHLKPSTMATFHTWSLSAEEQFYVIWSVLLVTVPRKHLGKLLVFLFAIAPLIRLLSYFALPQLRSLAPYEFQTRYDFLVIGCLLAFDCTNDWPTVRRLLPYRRPALVVTTAIAVAVEAADPTKINWFLYLFGNTVQALALASILGICILGPRDGKVGRTLNSRVFVHVGTIAYGLYIWQMLFTLAAVRPFTDPAIGVPAALVCAELSWWLVDKPLIKVRRRLRTPPPAVVPKPEPVAVPAGVVDADAVR
jgi:peptidoglycan/LPS O-acetylase OafA/YrhL